MGPEPLTVHFPVMQGLEEVLVYLRCCAVRKPG